MATGSKAQFNCHHKPTMGAPSVQRRVVWGEEARGIVSQTSAWRARTRWQGRRRGSLPRWGLSPSSSLQAPAHRGEARDMVPVLHLPCLLSWSCLGWDMPAETEDSTSHPSWNRLCAPTSQGTWWQGQPVMEEQMEGRQRLSSLGLPPEGQCPWREREIWCLNLCGKF